MLHAQLKMRTTSTILLTLTALTCQAAAISNPTNIPAGQTVNISPGDRLVTSGFSGAGSSGIGVAGVLKNQGQIFTTTAAVAGRLENDGLLIANSSLTIGNGSSDGTTRKILNNAKGSIILNGYMDLYSSQSVVENAGNILFSGFDSHGQIFIVFRGLIHNTGRMSFDKTMLDPQGQLGDICGGESYGSSMSSDPGDGQIINDGLFEIAKNTKCDLGVHPYTQNSGTTRVDGLFSNEEGIYLNKGALTGSGTIGHPTFGPGVTIAPGADLGTLTIDGDMDFGGSIEMQLGGAVGNDKLVVNGDLNLNYARLFISFREQYLLGLGQEITLITANNITGSAILAGFPRLPANWRYELVQTATSIKMRINTTPL